MCDLPQNLEIELSDFFLSEQLTLNWYKVAKKSRDNKRQVVATYILPLPWLWYKGFFRKQL